MSDSDQTTDSIPLRYRLPTTVSVQWKTAFENLITLIRASGGLPKAPIVADIDEWSAFSADNNQLGERLAAPVLSRLGPQTRSHQFGGVAALEYIPRVQRRDDRRLIYLHGGGYIAGSAKANAIAPSTMADLLEESVFSIDYTLAPASRFEQTTDEVVAVFDAMNRGGISPNRTVLFGDSAGGGLAVAATLKMRDRGKQMPAALALWSPYLDLLFQGDSIRTLAHVDFADMERATLAATMYAGPDDLKNPYASPIYGNFSHGFPPTLIQAGTREVMLSDSVRLYQALEAAHCVAKLDLYEGMPHVHQAMATASESPEALLACRKTAHFLQHWLTRSPD